MPSIAVRISNVGKSYGQTKALDGVSMSIVEGTVHAILGENGAGKSTLIKILTGVLTPDTGTIELNVPSKNVNKKGSETHGGLATVFQELSLVPHLSVSDNLFLDNPPRARFGWIDIKRQNTKACECLKMVGLEGLDPRALVADLTLTQKQLIEIAKALAKKPRILLLDEATASLPGKDVDRLFKLIKDLKTAGLTVIYISHRMSEIDRIADCCSILRNGKHIETFETKSKSHDEVCMLLAGREISQVFPQRRSIEARMPVALDVLSLSALDKVNNVSFHVRKGEIVGLGGLEGQGQKELLLALYGAIRPSSGTVKLFGKPFAPSAPSLATSGATPVMLLPEDRKTEGLLLPDSIAVNMLLSVIGKSSRFGFRNKRAESAMTASMVGNLKIKIAAPGAPVSDLSGGNQQKVLLARLLLNEPVVYILMDPTRGIDVGTKQEIYALMRKLAESGAAILFLTTDFEELIGMCDRVLVIYDGCVRQELEGEQINEVNILGAALNISIKNAAVQETLQ